VRKTWTAPGSSVTEETYYVYDAAGNLAAEYGTAGSTPGTFWNFTDLLGNAAALSLVFFQI
jgi:hypothetical protein